MNFQIRFTIVSFLAFGLHGVEEAGVELAGTTKAIEEGVVGDDIGLAVVAD